MHSWPLPNSAYFISVRISAHGLKSLGMTSFVSLMLDLLFCCPENESVLQFCDKNLSLLETMEF